MNSKSAGHTLLAFLLLLIAVAAYAQGPKGIDSLGGKLAIYGIKNRAPVLFIHFDKNVYSANENAWFTGYLFGADYKKYNLLSVTLVKDVDRSIILENKFLIKNGLAFGNTVIPNSTSPGNYSFIATTNRQVNGHPEVVFTQPVTIKSADQQEFTASLTAVDTSAALPAQKVLLSVNFIGQQALPAANQKTPPPAAILSYYVGNASAPVMKGFGKTEENKYLFNIPSKMLGPGNNWLHVQLQYKKDIKQVNMALPVAPRPATVRFYPEGGNLVNNLQSTIGWEAKNAAGTPIAVNAFLYENGKLIDTLFTNSYGLGRFSLKPKAGSSYTVKLYKVNLRDTVYQLPVAIAQGPVLSLPNAIVNDTLLVNLKDSRREKLYLIGHNYKQLFFMTPVTMAAVDKRIKILLKGIPKGLIQLTLTDSLGRPFSERMFFAHYNQRTPVNITTDKNEYTTRQKVNVSIKLDGSLADSGFVSVACVQENRVEIKKKNDIESYFYLKHDLEDLPLRETYLNGSEADRQFLENMLLIKGWRRYIWTDVLKAKPADTIRSYTELVFKGNITQYNKPLSKPVALVNMNRPLVQVMTDKNGAFTLTNNDLLIDSGKKAYFMVKEPDPTLYTIRLADRYTFINELLAGQLQPKDYTAKGQETTNYMQVPDNERAIHLKEVNIKGNNDGSFYGRDGKNLQNHPQSGAFFNARVAGINYTGGALIFETDGPKEYILGLNGIYEAKDFYTPDYSKNPEEQEYLSTLYWKHLVKVSSANTTDLSFFTGDITGKFKIIVQGITGNDVTYGETTFNVIKPK